MSENSLNPIQTQWLLDTAQQHGISLDEIKKTFHHPLINTKTNWNELPYTAYNQLFDWLSHSLNIPELGLVLGQEVEASAFGGSGLMIYHSATLNDVCYYLSRYDHSISKGIVFRFEQGKQQSRLSYNPVFLSSKDTKQDVNMTFSMMVTFCRKFLNDNWLPASAEFRHSKSENMVQYHALFGNNIHFSQPENVITFNNADLQTAITTADPYLLEIFRQHTETHHKNILKNDSFLDCIRYYIAASIEDPALCNAEFAAKKFNMTRRTLTRKLLLEGTNFRDLRNKVIIDMAKKALINSDASTTAIAEQLGFSESSAFNRAFKNMTGLTPRQYRQV